MQGFVNSGNQDYMLDNLRWIADFFIKCHHDDLAFTAGVGDPNVDHGLWERPEDIQEARPAYDLTPNAPGMAFWIVPIATLPASSGRNADTCQSGRQQS